MPITVEQNQAIARSLAPNPWGRVQHSEILPRSRRGGGVIIAPLPLGFEPLPPGPITPGEEAPGPGPGPAPAPAPTPVAPLVPGEGFLIVFNMSVPPDDVASAVSRKIRGPFVVNKVYIVGGAGATGTNVYHFVRVDFSQDNALQSIAFNDGGFPTGYTPESITLFDEVTLESESGTPSGNANGWFRLLSSSSTNDAVELSIPVGKTVPYEDCYVKVYQQNDSSAGETSSVILNCARLVPAPG